VEPDRREPIAGPVLEDDPQHAPAAPRRHELAADDGADDGRLLEAGRGRERRQRAPVLPAARRVLQHVAQRDEPDLRQLPRRLGPEVDATALDRGVEQLVRTVGRRGRADGSAGGSAVGPADGSAGGFATRGRLARRLGGRPGSGVARRPGGSAIGSSVARAASAARRRGAARSGDQPP
jgi:hypothetical protein